jgi:type I restriction enzyme S subunit
MKESGVEWIGKVPKVWEVKKLKYCLKLLDNRRRPLSGEERSHMSERAFDYYGASGIIDKVEDFIFDEDLILVAEDGANLLSRSTPLAFIARGKYWVNNHAHILKPLKQNSLGYFGYQLQLFDYTPLISGSAQPKLTGDRLKNIFLIVPPIEEQKKIVQYIDTETATIDETIALIEKSIALLEEYKTSLILHVVTGKIKIS